MYIGICFLVAAAIIAIALVAAAIIAIALVAVHKKHHGSGGCIRNCDKCPNPCHHKGRF